MTDNTKSEVDAESLAKEVLTVSDWRRIEAEGLSAAEFLRKHRNVEPADYDNHHDLRVAALTKQEENLSDTDEENIAVGESGNARVDGAAEAEVLASQVLTVSDWRKIERTDTDAQTYVAETFGVDPREYRSESKLREAISEAKRS